MVGPGGRSSLVLKCLLEFIAFLATIEKNKAVEQSTDHTGQKKNGHRNINPV